MNEKKKWIISRNNIDAINTNNLAIRTSLQSANIVNSKLAVPQKTPMLTSRKNSMHAGGVKKETSTISESVMNNELTSTPSPLSTNLNRNIMGPAEPLNQNIFDVKFFDYFGKFICG